MKNSIIRPTPEIGLTPAPDAAEARGVFSRRQTVLAGLAFSFAGATAAAAAEPKATGKITIEQVQIAFIGSGNLGGGQLQFGGKAYNFTIGGLGIGGFGISRMQAVGTVYDLNRLQDFPGAYLQARYGLAIGELSAGELWLKNANGVALSLKAERQGLALSLGGDAIYINFD